MDPRRFQSGNDGNGTASTTSAASALSSSCPIQAAVETAAAIASSTTSTAALHHGPPSNAEPSITSTLPAPPQNLLQQGWNGGGSSALAPGSTVATAAAVIRVSVPQLQAPQTPLPMALPAVVSVAAAPPPTHHAHALFSHQYPQQHYLHPPSSAGPVMSVAPAPSTAAAASRTPGTTQPAPAAQTAMLNHPMGQQVVSLTPCVTPGVMPYSQMGNGMTAAVAAGQPMVMPFSQPRPQVPAYPLTSQTPQLPTMLSHAQLVKRRAGKWTLEEEDYAAILIEMFEKGLVLDEKNGVTLRSFLSRKLYCAPMRISKKYAGKGIGKKVFINKVGPPFSDPSKPPTPAFYANIARMKEAEVKFLRAAFPELQALLCPFLCGPFVSGNQIPRESTGTVAPPLLTMAPTAPQPMAPKSGPSPTNQEGSDRVLQRSAMATEQQSVSLLPSSSVIMTTSMPTSSLVASTNPATHLQQQPDLSHSNSAAVHLPGNSGGGMANQVGTVGVETQVQPRSSASTNHGSSQSPETAESLCLPPTPLLCPTAQHEHARKEQYGAVGAVQRLHEAYVNSILKQATTFATHNTNNVDSTGNSDPKGGHFEPKSPTQDGIPDFLSGFDKVSGCKVEVHHPPGDYDPFSPTYTTESFDDLHQFLGKNLTPLITKGPSQGSNVNAKPMATTLIMPRIQSSSSSRTKKRVPYSRLQMRPLTSNGPWDTFREELGPISEEGEELSAVHPTSSKLRNTAKSYDLLAQETAQATWQNSACFQGHQGGDTTQRELLRMLGQDFGVHGAPLNDSHTVKYSDESFSCSRSTPAAISDSSDLASDDVNSGNESCNFADSDETHSEASIHRKKRAKTTSGDDDEDDVRRWYKTLVEGPQH